MDTNIVLPLIRDQVTASVNYNTLILALFSLLGTIATSISAFFIAKISTNTKTAAVNSQEAKETAIATGAKTDSLLHKTEEIHTLTNSNLSKVTTALEMSQSEVKGLKDIISQLSIQINETNHTLARLRQEKDVNTEKHNNTESVKASVKEAVNESIKAPVIQAVQESVKAPVKEAVLETRFTQEQIDQIIEALASRKIQNNF